MVDYGRVKTFHISFRFPPIAYCIGVKIYYVSSNYCLISHKKKLLLFIIDFLFLLIVSLLSKLGKTIH